MDLMKLRFYIEILGISVTIALTYIMIANFFLGIENEFLSIAILAFSWAVLFTSNYTARELWNKWTKR
jgi:hypothetical protein